MEKIRFIKRAYVTKWALTRGIVTVDGCSVGRTGYLHKVPYDIFLGSISRADWFEDPKKAEARVREMMKARIASLQLQLKKLTSRLPEPVKMMKARIASLQLQLKKLTSRLPEPVKQISYEKLRNR